MHEAHRFVVVRRLVEDRAGIDLLRARIEAVAAGGVMLAVRDGDFKLLRHLRQAFLDVTLHGLRDGLLDGFAGVQRMHGLHAVAVAAVDGDRLDVRIELMDELAQGGVARHADHGDAQTGRDQGVDVEFGGGLAVDRDKEDAGRHRVGQRVAVVAGGRVVACEDARVEALVEALHHAVRITHPAADEADLAGQLVGDQIACAVMGVFDDDVRRAVEECGIGGGGDFACHLLAEIIVWRLGFRPYVDARRAFNVCADENL